jgi:AbrB family looped-hinge helix DNA binding protein
MAVDETTVTDRGGSVIPAALRERLDIEPGDKLRWELDDDDTLRVTVVRQRPGAFTDFEPASGPPTNAVAVEREFGADRE